MSILLCHSCGSILKSNSKYCVGCGTNTSSFSQTQIQEANPLQPLSISVQPYPMILEKVINASLSSPQYSNNNDSNHEQINANSIEPLLVEHKEEPDAKGSSKFDFFAHHPPISALTLESNVNEASKANLNTTNTTTTEIEVSNESTEAVKSLFKEASQVITPIANGADNFFADLVVRVQNKQENEVTKQSQESNDKEENIAKKEEHIKEETKDTQSSNVKVTAENKEEPISDPNAKPNIKDKSSRFATVIGFFQNLNEEITVFGKKFSKKTVVILGSVLLIISLQLIGLVINIAGGFLSNTTNGIAGLFESHGPVISLEGSWQFAFQSAGASLPHPGQMTIEQNGNTIYGEGRDDEYFQFKGSINGQKVYFVKQYIVAGKQTGKPITYGGEIRISKQAPPYMSGVFIAQVKKGVFYNAHFEEVRGRWEAQMAQQGTEGQFAQGNNSQGTNINFDDHDPRKTQNTLLQIAVGIVIFGIALAMFALKLFGPNGLINIWHKKEYIPSQFKSQHKKMLRDLGKSLKKGGLPLGDREDWNFTKLFEPKSLALPPNLRDQNPHLLIMGAGAKGKTRLLANMITQDILSADRGVVVIDSDGHLVDLILRWVSSHPQGNKLSNRISVIDPTSKDGCTAFNPLQVPEDDDYQSAASSLVYGFKAIYTEPPGSQSQWNQQTANILRNATLLLMANNKTLTDLPTLLGDNDFRDVLLEKIEKRKNERIEFITLLDQWAQYKRLARTDQWITWVEPILNRVSPMLGDPRIRPILTKPNGGLSLNDIIKEHKVLLVKIPQGQLDQNANLLGSLLVTGIKQAALSLSSSNKEKCMTALYLDELDNFVEKETFDAITSETRKFQIGLTAAVKTIQHLPEDFRNQLIINVGTVCAFSLAKKDADILGPQMFRVDGRKIKHQTIQNVFNKVNTSPQFELISDEEKLNIDRLVGQEERTYFCYRVGTVAGVFHMKATEFKDIADKDINYSLIDQMYGKKVK